MSRHKESMSVVSRDINGVNVWFFPIGFILTHTTRFSQDDTTRQALVDIGNELDIRGALVNEAHIDKFGIMALAAAMAGHYPQMEKMTGPMAYKWLTKIEGRQLKNSIDKKLHLDVIPVFRKEDKKYADSRLWKYKSQSNREFLEFTRNTLSKPRTMGIVAPYGSRSVFLDSEKLRHGPAELALDFPFTCSLAVRSPGYLGYTIYLSEFVKPREGTTVQAMKDHFQEQFSELVALSGYTPPNSKSRSPG